MSKHIVALELNDHQTLAAGKKVNVHFLTPTRLRVAILHWLTVESPSEIDLRVTSIHIGKYTVLDCPKGLSVWCTQDWNNLHYPPMDDGGILSLEVYNAGNLPRHFSRSSDEARVITVVKKGLSMKHFVLLATFLVIAGCGEVLPASETAHEDAAAASAAASSNDAPDASTPDALRSNVPCRNPAMVRAGVDCIDREPVTATDYDTFVNLAGPMNYSAMPVTCDWKTSHARTRYPDVRVAVGIDWCDAHAYCHLLGKRLCGHASGRGLMEGELSGAEDTLFTGCKADVITRAAGLREWFDGPCVGSTSAAECQIRDVSDCAAKTAAQGDVSGTITFRCCADE